MKKQLLLIATTLLGLALLPAGAQPGPQGPNFDRAIEKLFGDNQAFSANVEFQTSERGGEAVTMPGSFSFDGGKSRFEINMSEMKGSKMPPQAAEQMKAMGMDKVITISRPDKKLAYIIYPGMKSYAAMTPPGADTAASPSDFKLETTQLGKETVDGHACIKNKVIATGKDGTKVESTVWNATDLNKFPVKIETTQSGQKVVMLYKNISLKKPAASQFDTPEDFTKYDSIQSMIQTVMMKQMGGGMGKPPVR
jgi:hypothetical protein